MTTDNTATTFVYPLESIIASLDRILSSGLLLSYRAAYGLLTDEPKPSERIDPPPDHNPIYLHIIKVAVPPVRNTSNKSV